MSIVKLHKAYLIMQNSQQEDIIAQLQQLAIVHICVKSQETLEQAFCPSEIKQLREAIDYLTEVKHHRRYLVHIENSPDDLINQILTNKHQIQDIKEKIISIHNKIQLLAPWGNFNLQAAKLNNYQLHFIKLSEKELSIISEEITYQVVNRDENSYYVVIIQPQGPLSETLVPHQIELPNISLKELEKQLDGLYFVLEDLKDTRKMYTKYLKYLQNKIIEFEDISNLNSAIKSSADLKNFCLYQMYVPKNNLEDLENFAKQHQLALVHHKPQTTDQVPTLMQTPKILSGGQKLTEFYQIPGYHTVNPSISVFISFASFFAIITADAGYGILLTLISFYLAKNLQHNQQSLAPLFIGIGLLSIGYGVMVGSYFGLSPPKNSWIYDLKIIDVRNFNFMMQFSIYIGFLHIILANLMVLGYSESATNRKNSIGTLLLLTAAGIAYLTPLLWLASCFIIAAIISFIYFAPVPKNSSSLAYLFYKISGLMQLSQITSLFSDIMSYMRLFALALSGASLSATFNQLASNTIESMPGIGFFLATIILILGHSLNFLIAIMSGVVHGLRLNFIEFFRWSISEEGYKFIFFSKGEKINGNA